MQIIKILLIGFSQSTQIFSQDSIVYKKMYSLSYHIAETIIPQRFVLKRNALEIYEEHVRLYGCQMGSLTINRIHCSELHSLLSK